MILLTFLSFFFVKDQIACFQLKQTVVFLKCSVCVFNMISAYFIFIELITTDHWQIGSEYHIQLTL